MPLLVSPARPHSGNLYITDNAGLRRDMNKRTIQKVIRSERTIPAMKRSSHIVTMVVDLLIYEKESIGPLVQRVKGDAPRIFITVRR